MSDAATGDGAKPPVELKSAEEVKVTRDDWRKKKELDEARKAGTAPAERDELTGLDINPHIPEYMVKQPWYMDTGKTSLHHQRLRREHQDLAFKSHSEKLGLGVSLLEEKKRKQQVSDPSLDRPSKKRRKGMKSSVGNKTAIDKRSEKKVDRATTDITYETKRDRYNYYDVSEYQKVIVEHEKVETMRSKLRAEQIAKKEAENAAKRARGEKVAEDDDSSDDDEFKYAEGASAPGVRLGLEAGTYGDRMSVRNLRIREDVPKYLFNLDVNSAHYDPKSRSMRSNPLAGDAVKGSKIDYQGDNFHRFTGEVVDMTKAQVYAWQASERGADVHMEANPTLAAKLYGQYGKKKEDHDTKLKSGIVDKYGGAEHLKEPPASVFNSESEHYVEYSREGKVVKGQEKAIARSRYVEDIHPQNHTSVWGSHWQDGVWGYACCWSNVRSSYCVGAKGKELRKAESELTILDWKKDVPKVDPSKQRKEPVKSLQQQHTERMAREAADGKTAKTDEKPEDTEAAKEKRIQELMKKMKADKASGDKEVEVDDRSRKYNSFSANDVEVNEEEMEAYRRLESDWADPMKNFSG